MAYFFSVFTTVKNLKNYHTMKNSNNKKNDLDEKKTGYGDSDSNKKDSTSSYSPSTTSKTSSYSSATDTDVEDMDIEDSDNLTTETEKDDQGKVNTFLGQNKPVNQTNSTSHDGK